MNFAAEFLDKASEHVAIACFIATYSNILMWSHYANAHKGFVVGFDTSWENFRLGWGLFPVEYSDDRAIVDFVPMRGLEHEEVFRLAKTKSKHWSYELEYRQIFNLPARTRLANGGQTYFVSVDPSAIRTIIFGYRCPQALEVSIRRAVAKHELSVRYMRAAIHQTKYELEFHEC